MIGYGGYRRKQGGGCITSAGMDDRCPRSFLLRNRGISNPKLRAGERLEKKLAMETHLATSLLPKSLGNRVEISINNGVLVDARYLPASY